MKNLFALSLLFTMFLVSCGNNQTKKESTTDEVITEEKSAVMDEVNETKNCDEFLDNYEKWVDDYLKVIEKYMKNPMDQSLMTDYTKLANEAMTWYSQWDVLKCASREKYEKRFDEISEKVDKKMEELGLD
ncbi:DUF6591 domain-containing protein [uncultured Draconibacterium sp.]|uniref:DUF6591 domain-containing protein n=1 Tax=uncultured Draconibacterium sp. TaxID=1573823 RepID=UPI003217C520